jgi:2-methylisocitrate lyase-like PEP mutase family enzyme
MPANPPAARAFHDLHRQGLLILANAWDAGSARLFESLGAKAIATTSCGVAWSHGYPDGDFLPMDRVVWTVASIARVVSVPVTADIEGGYSDDPAEADANAARVIEAGAAGVNIEDGSASVDLTCRKIEAVRAAADRVGVDLFINARCDVYLRGLAPEGAQAEETLQRAARYRAAGASGLFAPGVVNPEEIRALAEGAGMPLNVMARKGLPDGMGLEALGVRRLSSGGDLAEAAFGRVRDLASAFLASGDANPLTDGAMSYPDLNALMLKD